MHSHWSTKTEKGEKKKKTKMSEDLKKKIFEQNSLWKLCCAMDRSIDASTLA